MWIKCLNRRRRATDNDDDRENQPRGYPGLGITLEYFNFGLFLPPHCECLFGGMAMCLVSVDWLRCASNTKTDRSLMCALGHGIFQGFLFLTFILKNNVVSSPKWWHVTLALQLYTGYTKYINTAQVLHVMTSSLHRRGPHALVIIAIKTNSKLTCTV